MKFLITMAGVGVVFWGAGVALGKLLRFCDQVPYQPDPRYTYREGYDKPDARYDAMSSDDAKRRADLIKLAVAGVSPVSTPESIELAKAYQRTQRRAAGLTDEGTLKESSRVH